MAAHDDATVTIDTNEMTYTDQNGARSLVNNAETFVLDLAAVGTSEKCLVVVPAILDLADGRRIRFDGLRSSFILDTNATAKVNCGSLWFEEENGYRAEWKIRTATLDDIDQPTALTMVLERVDNPMITMTLTAVTVSQ